MGFKDQTVDHYGRIPWLLNVGLCLGSQPQYQVQLTYIKSYMKSYPGKQKFGLTFFSDLCHRTPSLVRAADSRLVAFFSSLKNENLLNDTVFITMSDHDGLFGDLGQSPQGKLEHWLPLLSVTFPSWFKSKYPEHMAGMVKNTRIITSSYDLHATLKHLLTFLKKPFRATSIWQDLWRCQYSRTVLPMSKAAVYGHFSSTRFQSSKGCFELHKQTSNIVY